MLHTPSIDQANKLKKKGKIQEAMKILHQCYHLECSECIEKTLYELEMKVAKKYHLDHYNAIIQAVKIDNYSKISESLDFFDKKYYVWPQKIRVGNLLKQNKKEKALPLLNKMKYFLPEERAFLCEVLLRKDEELMTLYHAQKCLNYLSPTFINLLQKKLHSLLDEQIITNKFIEKIPHFYFVESKGLNWLESFLNKSCFTKYIELNVFQLFRLNNWQKGKKFIKKHEEKLSHLPYINNIKFKFNWFSAWEGKKTLDAEQYDYLIKITEKLLGENKKIKEQLISIVKNDNREEAPHISLLLDYNPIKIFRLSYNFTRNNIMQGMLTELSKKKINPRQLLLLQRIMMDKEFHPLIRYLFCWPQESFLNSGDICVH